MTLSSSPQAPSTRRLCLITGASAGIGAAFARVYAANGWDVALTARREDRLRDLQNELESAHDVKAHVFGADLADPAAPRLLLAAIAGAGRQVDGLVNNAGYGVPGGYLSADWDTHAKFMQVLVTAPAELAHRLLPGMKARDFGRIINVASLAGLVPAGAGHTLYGPAKSFMVHFSEALNAECKGTGVHVTGLCPGFTYSEFHDVNGMRETISEGTSSLMWQTAEAVAQAGYEACERGAPVRVSGGVNKAIATLAKILPDPMARALVQSQTSRYRDQG